MILLIKKDCVFCDKFKDIDIKFPQIKKFYVENNMIQMEDKVVPLDPKIPAVPALIISENSKVTVYCGDYISEFIKTLE